jgi:hypothetical protein
MKRIAVKQEHGSWEFDNTNYFEEVKSNIDNNIYKIYNTKGKKPERISGKLELLPVDTSPEMALQLANILARVRADINKLLIYTFKHSEIWKDHPIAWGIYHTFDIHIPCWKETLARGIIDQNVINYNCLQRGQLFVYQEMPKNDGGILGLNVPEVIYGLELNFHGKKIVYDVAERRAIYLTLRYSNGTIYPYEDILDLALHELTHTTCNDCRWKPDNHLPPYKSYRTIINKLAEGAGLKFGKK